jgi:hypothetical protein
MRPFLFSYDPFGGWIEKSFKPRLCFSSHLYQYNMLIQGLSDTTRTCRRFLLSALFISLFLPGASRAADEVAVLVIRHDNVKKVTDSELIPVAKIVDGKYISIAAADPDDKGVCAPVDFRAWSSSGLKYDIYFRGDFVGSTVSGKRTRGGYSCTELCVVSAKTSLLERVVGLQRGRKGFGPEGSFDEDINFYVTYLSSEGKQPFNSRVSQPLMSTDRADFTRYARQRLASKGGKGQVSVDSIVPFLGSTAGEVQVFISARMSLPDDVVRDISTVVTRSKEGTIHALYELLDDGDIDRGGESHELVDVADFDGDGRTDLLLLFHNYEFHEFQIMKQTDSGFETVHKGPSFGC